MRINRNKRISLFVIVFVFVVGVITMLMVLNGPTQGGVLLPTVIDIETTIEPAIPEEPTEKKSTLSSTPYVTGVALNKIVEKRKLYTSSYGRGVGRGTL